jgi:GNAT superfamily N-acetyltransferase
MTPGSSPPEETSRPATSDDVPRLAELAGTAIDELSVGRGGEVWARTQARRPPLEDGFRAELASPAHLVLVGELDGAAVAYGVVRLDELADGGRLGVVTDLYVEAEARGVGLGELLMDALVAWCTEQGCIGVDSLALPGDRATKNFFESFGLVARAIVVHRALGER